MHVLEPVPRHPVLDELLEASANVRVAAAAAIARSRELTEESSRLQERLATRRRRAPARDLFARVEGVVDGAPVSAVVGSDGSVAGDRALLQRAHLVVAVGDTFDEGRLGAAMGGEALATTLTLTRACDRVLQVDMAIPAPVAGGSDG